MLFPPILLYVRFAGDNIVAVRSLTGRFFKLHWSSVHDGVACRVWKIVRFLRYWAFGLGLIRSTFQHLQG